MAVEASFQCATSVFFLPPTCQRHKYHLLSPWLLADLAGDAGSGFDVRLAAIGLTALLDGLWLELCLNPRTFSPEEGVKLCESWVETHLAGRLAKHPLSQSQASPPQRKPAAGKRR